MDWLSFLVPWQPSPTVIAVALVTAGLYASGQRREHPSWWRALAFWSGLILTYLALQSRWDYYAEREFFVHRLQHLVLHHAGTFLMALAHPGPTLRAGWPRAWRRGGLDRLLASPPVRMLADFVMQPVVAGVLFVGLIWLWLLPSVHFYAMLDVDLYRVMNWSMTLDGLFFWVLVLDRRASPPARLSPPQRLLLLAAVIPPQLLSGAIITLAPGELYPLYDLCGRAFAGISPHADQTIGGLILWIPSTMMSLLGALIAMADWYRAAEARPADAPGS